MKKLLFVISLFLILTGCEQKINETVTEIKNVVETQKPTWQIVVEKDKLTNEVKEKLFYRSKIELANYPKANIEISVKNSTKKIDNENICEQKIEAKFFDTPNLKTKSVEIYGSYFEITVVRNILYNNQSIRKFYFQGNYSNVFEEIFDNIKLDFDFLTLPKKTEFTFDDGQTVIVDFDEANLKYLKQCLGIQK